MLFYRAFDFLSVDFNVAVARPEYNEFVSGDTDYGGNSPRNVPEKTANLWLTWQPTGHWLVGAGIRYVGERYLNNENSSTLPSYSVWDLSIQWMINNELSLSLRGKNLSNTKDYVLAPYGNQWVLGDGRTAELSVNYRY